MFNGFILSSFAAEDKAGGVRLVLHVTLLLHMCLQDHGEDIISTAWADAACLLISVLHYHSREPTPSAKKHRGVQQTQAGSTCAATQRKSALTTTLRRAKISRCNQASLKSFWCRTCHWQQWAELMRWLLIRQAKQICSYYLSCLQCWKRKRDSGSILIHWKLEQMQHSDRRQENKTSQMCQKIPWRSSTSLRIKKVFFPNTFEQNKNTCHTSLRALFNNLIINLDASIWCPRVGWWNKVDIWGTFRTPSPGIFQICNETVPRADDN